MENYTLYPSLDLSKIAQDILALWKKERTFEQTLKQRQHSPAIHFYEGPPGANGLPGIHHIFCRALKDLFCRYKTMQGHYVARKGGWDTHGLPVEISVESELGITKQDIGNTISIASYNAACRKTVWRYQKEWEAITERIGYWIDLKNPYITCDTDYISSVWGVIKALYDKNLVYKDYAIQPYSPAAGTGLSTHELNQPGCYKEVKDISIVAQFAITTLPNTYLLAWTTTPWTLPANSALAVDKNITYVKVRTYNPYTRQPINVVLSQAAVLRYFDSAQENKPMKQPLTPSAGIPWRIVASGKGQGLIGLRYQQLLPYVKPKGNAFKVIAADFVSDKEGTGIVHIAPTFGSDDAHAAKTNGIVPITVRDQKGIAVPIVDKQGRFVKEIVPFAGRYVKQAYAPNAQPSVDIDIAKHLKKTNKAFHVAKHQHSYPHCWRTDKPILYYPIDAWFIKTTAVKQQLIQHNKKINWQPKSTGKGRFGEWLNHLVDWNITRDRFWGTPLPLWCTKDHKETICIGSLKALRSEVAKSVSVGFMAKQLPDNIDLHRPHVDDIILVSPTGKKMFREPGIFDVWGDSGAMPYAQHTYIPFDRHTPPQAFPADFIIEGIDQTRGWFFTLHVLAVMLYHSCAFNNVLATGLVLDKKGQKMSKRLGNAINPNQVLTTYGPDVLRWYMVINADPWENLKFDMGALPEVQRKFFATLYNTYQFFALYANLDNFTSSDALPTPVTQSDRWILSRLQGVIATATASLNRFSPTQAARAIQHFVVDDLSNWYVRLNRKRFWKGGYDQDKKAAYQTLYHALRTIAQLAAPIAPFYMDHLYRDLTRNPQASVHLTIFPKEHKPYLDLNLEKAMHSAKVISSLVHRLRKKHGIKVRQPLRQMLLPVTTASQKTPIQAVMDLILAETNVKQIKFVEGYSTTAIEQKIRQSG